MNNTLNKPMPMMNMPITTMPMPINTSTMPMNTSTMPMPMPMNNNNNTKNMVKSNEILKELSENCNRFQLKIDDFIFKKKNLMDEKMMKFRKDDAEFKSKWSELLESCVSCVLADYMSYESISDAL